MARDRAARLKEAKRRLEEELRTEVRANTAYEHYRVHGRMKNGRRLGAHSPPKPYTPPVAPAGTINVTDPDSRIVKGLRGFCTASTASCDAAEPASGPSGGSSRPPTTSWHETARRGSHRCRPGSKVAPGQGLSGRT